MRVVIASSLILGLLSACGSDSSGTGQAAGGTSSGGSAGAGGSSASGGSSGSGATGGAAGSSGTGATGGSAGSSGPTQCGASLVCAELSVCIVDEIAPTCTPKNDPSPCPSGQTETQCGGAGFACCCEPTPPPEYRCEGKGICGAVPDCTCLGPTICKNGQQCTAISGNAWEFHCMDPAQP